MIPFKPVMSETVTKIFQSVLIKNKTINNNKTPRARARTKFTAAFIND